MNPKIDRSYTRAVAATYRGEPCAVCGKRGAYYCDECAKVFCGHHASIRETHDLDCEAGNSVDLELEEWVDLFEPRDPESIN